MANRCYRNIWIRELKIADLLWDQKLGCIGPILLQIPRPSPPHWPGNGSNGFPDCEAMQQITPERWQRVHIEFEFESRNFRDHGHPPAGCDVIVRWRHNWDDGPEGIEVVEQSSVIESLASAED